MRRATIGCVFVGSMLAGQSMAATVWNPSTPTPVPAYLAAALDREPERAAGQLPLADRLSLDLQADLPARAFSVGPETADLGSLDLRYSDVESIDRYRGRPLAAEGSFRQGEGISLVTPHRVQQITYLVSRGERVEAGQSLAVLSGPEIHHFKTEFEVTQQRLAMAKKRYQSNRKLYQNKAIDEGRWMEISEAYLDLQLEFEHMRHFRELLIVDDRIKDSMTLVAPAAGILSYHQDTPGIASGEELALLIPEQAFRFKVSIPLAGRSGLVALESGECVLKVDSISGIADGFFVEGWSAPLDDNCSYLPGQRLMMTPLYQFAGYRVPRSAVFQWEGVPTVLLRSGQQLETVAVELLSSDGHYYAVACAADLSAGEVLSTSVSAVQGVLMGLGGE